MVQLSLEEKFEDAISVRDKYAHFNRAASRIERLNSIAKLPELIVARPSGEHWEFVSIRYGRLAATNVSTPTTSVAAALDALQIMAEQVADSGFLQQVNHEEVELILNYLTEPGLRLVKVEGEYAFATFGPTSQSFRTGSYEFASA